MSRVNNWHQLNSCGQSAYAYHSKSEHVKHTFRFYVVLVQSVQYRLELEKLHSAGFLQLQD